MMAAFNIPTLTSKVETNPNARGLAIIITNDYTGTPEWPERIRVLPGTKVDGENLSRTFLSLNFVVHWKHNVDRRTLDHVMYETRHLKHKKVQHYECVVFIFSGHGIGHSYVYSQDRQSINISHQLIEPLLPKCAPELGNISKIFLIDACRGEKRLSSVHVPVSVPKGGIGASISRGCTVIEAPLRVPAEGNFLAAYSTMPDYEAYEESDGSGGIWLTMVAKKIQECQGVSILDVLTEVNAEMVRMSQTRCHLVQQPELVNRLNKRVILNRNPENDCQGEASQRERPVLAAALIPQTTAAALAPHSHTTSSTAAVFGTCRSMHDNHQHFYSGILSHLEQKGVIEYSDQELYKWPLSIKHALTGTQITVVGLSRSSKTEAGENAAKDAFAQIEALENPAGVHYQAVGSFRGVKRLTGPALGAVIRKCPSSSHTILGDSDVPKLMLKLAVHASKWRFIGTALLFTSPELDTIQAMPKLFDEAPISYLHEVLNQWVQWPNEAHEDHATLKSLEVALRSQLVGLGRVAEELKESLAPT